VQGIKTAYSITRRNKSLGNDTWYGRIHDGGKIRYVSLKTTSKSRAQEWLTAQWSKCAAQESPKNEGNDCQDHKRKRIVPEINLRQVMRKWLVSIEASKGADSLTFRDYESRVKKFVLFLESRRITDFSGITVSIVVDFVGEMASKYSGKTAGEIIKIAHTLWDFWDSLLDNPGKNPFEKIKRPKIIKSLRHFWTKEQCERIIAAAPDENYAFLWSLMAFEGLRYEEASSLTWEAISDEKITLIGKMNKLASIPVSKKIRKFLKQRETGKIFTGKIHPHNDKNLAELRRAVASTGLVFNGEITHHRFRHSFASNLIRAGVNIKAVQQLMRHESVQITLNTYSHLIDSDLRQAINAIDGIQHERDAYTMDDLGTIQALYDGSNVAELSNILGIPEIMVRRIASMLVLRQNMPVLA